MIYRLNYWMMNFTLFNQQMSFIKFKWNLIKILKKFMEKLDN